jgi:GLPGLI family protein
MKKIIIIVITLITVVRLSAQSFSGTATYQSSSQVQLDLDSTAMSPQEMQQLKQQLTKKMQKAFTLKFNAQESLWEQLESVESGPASASSSGMEIMISNGSSKDKLYRNLAEGLSRNTKEMMGKRFLIIDSLPEYDWKITNETKQIGEYNCRRALYTKISEAKKFASGMEEMEIVQDTTEVEVWFTMDIPVSHGPTKYYGLPGLILELKANGRHFICTKVSMNYKNPEQISVPDRGEKVTKDEFEAISEDKMKEMMQRYKSNGDDSNIEIIIGG